MRGQTCPQSPQDRAGPGKWIETTLTRPGSPLQPGRTSLNTYAKRWAPLNSASTIKLANGFWPWSNARARQWPSSSRTSNISSTNGVTPFRQPHRYGSSTRAANRQMTLDESLFINRQKRVKVWLYLTERSIHYWALWDITNLPLGRVQYIATMEITSRKYANKCEHLGPGARDIVRDRFPRIEQFEIRINIRQWILICF